MTLLERIERLLETKYILDESKQDIETFAQAINKEIGDLDRSYQIANDFFQQKDRFKSSNPDTDIHENDYRTWIENKDGKHSISTLISRLETGSNTQIKKQQKMEGAIKIPTKNPDWEVIHITDYNAAKYYGENTTWCITGRYPDQGGDDRGRDFFNDYISKGVKGYYFLIDKKDPYNKWRYLDYGKNDVSDIQELFFSAKNRHYRLDDVLDDIPMDVLEVLPHLKDTIEQQKQLLIIIDEVKKTGIYTYTNNHTTSIRDAIAKYVKKVIVDNSVTSIGDWAFGSCTSLKEITIPNSVTSIGDSAFWNCTSLQEITIRGKYRPSIVRYIPSRIKITWADAIQNESYHRRRYYW